MEAIAPDVVGKRAGRGGQERSGVLCFGEVRMEGGKDGRVESWKDGRRRRAGVWREGRLRVRGERHLLLLCMRVSEEIRGDRCATIRS